jgi:1,2-diacylglycerol-3-alpha-glucose alpha-1,2-glucosyltransferase
MKVLLYLENKKHLVNSGIGRAIEHQAVALKAAGIDYTFDPDDTYDIAHINSYGPASYSLLKKCHKKGIKVIVHGHSTHQDFRDSFRCWQLMAPFYDAWMDRMYASADMVITPTKYSQDLIKSYPNVTCPVKAITNGVVLEDYQPNEEYVKAFKERFKVQPNEKIVVGAGFYFRRKGLDDFFKVAAKLPHVRFIWFGTLSKLLTQNYILSEIKKRPKNVELPGYIKGDIIKGAYQTASCMLFPTKEETEGIVALEALASHLPLVTRDIGVYKDWLTNGVNCYKGKTVDEFAAYVNKCINEDNTFLTDSGYKVAEERSIQRAGQELKEAYLELTETNI